VKISVNSWQRQDFEGVLSRSLENRDLLICTEQSLKESGIT